MGIFQVEISRWELSWVGIFFSGGFLGGNCPGRIIRVGLGVFLVPVIVVSSAVQHSCKIYTRCQVFILFCAI